MFDRLNEYFVAEVDVGTGDVSKFNPSGEGYPPRRTLVENYYERVVIGTYEEEREYRVEGIDHKRNNPLRFAVDRMPAGTEHAIRASLGLSTESDSSGGNNPIDVMERDGIPDLIACPTDSVRDFAFVEVKGPTDSIQPAQEAWMEEFNQLPIKIAHVFENEETWELF